MPIDIGFALSPGETALTAPDLENKLAPALLVMRLTIAAFLLVWVADKFFVPEHAQRVFESFYATSPSSGMLLAAALVQLIIVLAFAAGAFKTYSYGIVLLMHAVSNLVSWKMLINPLAVPNILFWAGIPVLGAMIALFMLREHDTLFAVSKT